MAGPKETKLTLGRDFRLYFWPHLPVDDATAPVASVRLDAGTQAPVMAVARANLAVTAVPDRRTLTVGAGAGAASRGLIGGRGGAAFLDLGADMQGPVRVQRVESTSVILAEPLPHGVPTTATGTIRWSLWHSLLLTATYSAVVERHIPWTFRWDGLVGADMPTDPQSYEGLMHVVRQPFETGLGDDELIDYFPALANRRPARSPSWGRQIELAEDKLVTWLRRDLRLLVRTAGGDATGVWEDEVHGPPFREVHALLTAYYVSRGETARGAALAEPRDRWLEDAKECYETVMARVPWVDLDGDGEPDPDEIGIGVGGVPVIVGGEFTTIEADTDNFTRRQTYDER